jgi:hypothetical protein
MAQPLLQDLANLGGLPEKQEYRMTWTDEQKRERMAKNLATILGNPLGWPKVNLPMKTQPWVTEAAGNMRFGWMARHSTTTVFLEGGDKETFASPEELVETWSVD